MASPAELSLDYKPNSYVVTQKQLGEQPEQSQKIQEFLGRLEEERHKIEAFKRELPLCMQLLNNAIEFYKQQLETYQTNQGPRPVLEEFIPLKNLNMDGSDKAPNAPSEKASWMTSAQLWSPPASDAAKQQPAPSKEADEVFDMSPKLALDTKQRNGGGAFLPFSKEKHKGVRAAPRALNPELALVAFSEKAAIEERKSVEMESGGISKRKENGTGGSGVEHGKGGGSSANEGQPTAAAPTHRKARRCWSPDLHRRFVNALQILGGSQVATPKQIRELMKVDGLTNDEVKSHLQKYRLHTRRPAPAPQAAATAAPQLVVLGGIWVPSEYATSAAAGPAIYGAHAASAHYCAAAPVPQEFYPPMPQPLQQHHHLHPPLHRGAEAYKGRAAGSPESEVRSGGERSESIEEDDEGEERDEEEEEEEEEQQQQQNPSAEEKALVPLTVKAEDGSGGGGLKL
ncbi:hypothetical protein Cni_G22890 [Canna indica]|uniref:HTH myb-type domain-containing protein n=1 Tax=Canna indica TaxID=4628 RepID=A0AAQ3KT35_9LILI|nr:hypothetical protein Cni_G22890 [Canna indica]